MKDPLALEALWCAHASGHGRAIPNRADAHVPLAPREDATRFPFQPSHRNTEIPWGSTAAECESRDLRPRPAGGERYGSYDTTVISRFTLAQRAANFHRSFGHLANSSF
jgi:hypothetical protein